MSLVAAISGHRPEKIDDPQWVKDALAEAFALFDVSRVIQGMASGVDLWSARVAYDARIPYVCARPWGGHKPRKDEVKTYESALRNAVEVVNVDPSEDYPGVWIYQVRNKWMVDNSDFLISVWDGSTGGTHNCVHYAHKIGVRVYNCNPKTKLCGFLVSPG